MTELQNPAGSPVGPIATDRIPWEEWSEGVRFGGRVRPIGALAGGSRVGVLMEELPPGKQSAPFHWHTREEEHMWFLEGRASLRLGDERHPVKAGDYVCFPAGRALGHCVVNDSQAACRYLVIGERISDDVCIYPDSRKVMVRSADRAVFSLDTKKDYWDGEQTDVPPT